MKLITVNFVFQIKYKGEFFLINYSMLVKNFLKPILLFYNITTIKEIFSMEVNKNRVFYAGMYCNCLNNTNFICYSIL